MGNNSCGERTRMESMNAFITDENLELKEQDNIVSQVTDKIFKVNLAKNELYDRIQSIDSETVQYLTEFICQLNRFSTKKLEDILTTTQANYKIIVQSILKCRPLVKQVSLLHETTNNLKLLHDLQKQKYEQLYHRPCYDNLYNLIREIKVKKYGQYVIKEDTSVDCELATKRMTAWLNLSTKNHPNVLNLRACKITDRACYYLTDYIKGQTLDQVNIVNNDEKISVAQQMIESVRFMHHHGLIHGDIKLSNFMYSNHVIILMDLDQMGSDKTDMTYLYSLKDSEYPSFNGDVYALGLCLYSIFSNQKIVKDFTFEMYKMRDQLNYGKIEEILKSAIQYKPKDITYLHYLCKFL